MAEQAKVKAYAAFFAGNFSDAVRHFSTAMSVGPTNYLLFSNRSAAYARLNKFSEALSDAEKTVKVKPDWSKGYCRLGAAHLGLGRFDDAVIAYKKGLECDPDDEALKSGLADAEYAASRSRAEPERKALARKEKELGNSAFGMKDFDAAIRALYEGDGVQRRGHFVSVESGPCLLENGTEQHQDYWAYEECIKDCDKVIESGRELRLDSKMIAIALTRKGAALVKMAKCSKDYEPAIETFQKALIEHHNLDTLKKLDDAEKAKRHLEQQGHFDPKLSNEGHEKGLGVKNLRRFNQALLGKWLWRYGTDREALWRQVVEAKYGGMWGGWCSDVGRGPYGVSLWKYIRRRWDHLFPFLSFKVGNGEKVQFWHDIWCGDRSLRVVYPGLFSIAGDRDASMADLISYRNDTLCWQRKSKGVFTVKSFYQSLSPSPSRMFPWKGVWKPKVPPRVAFFLWVTVLGKILTAENLRKRHIIITVRELIEGWQGLKHHQLRIWTAVPHCIMWSLWRERNSRIFEDRELTIEDLKLRSQATPLPLNNPFKDVLSWPKMWAKLSADPTTQAYLQNNDFVRMMHELHKIYLTNKRVIQALGVLLNINFRMPTSEDTEMPKSSSLMLLPPERKRGVEAELAKEPDPMLLTAKEEEMERKAQAWKEQELGNAAYAKNDFATAITHFTKVMELDDRDISCLMNRAVAYLAMGQGLAQVVKALVLEVCSLQGPRFNTSWCKQFLGATHLAEKPVIYPDPCRETSESAVHGSRGISQGAQAGPDTQGVIKLSQCSSYQDWKIKKYEECIKDCDNAVERGRELKSDSKMISIALTRKGTALVKMAKCSKDYEPAIETFLKALIEQHNPDTLKKLNDAEIAKRELEHQEYFDTELANEEHEKGIPL
uniref:Reverse transcriptase zinc-binding domain-containing protein n=1 Tax=Fagus sylvatica TaxID=28930 RepID=A0A2N9IJE2_FAGSY